jgi:multiple sugar transport system ATP-binding protein
VAIGRAIVKEPKAFLFDEPLSNLDAGLRVRTRVELAELHQRLGSTMIYVTHDQTEAMTLADRIVILNNCRIEQVGTPMEVYSRPASRFVASFIGSPAMNLMPVTLTGQGDRAAARLGDGRWCRCPAHPRARAVGTGHPARGADRWPEGDMTKATATVVERLGDRTLVYAGCRTARRSSRRTAASRRPRRGTAGPGLRHRRAAPFRRAGPPSISEGPCLTCVEF